MHADSLEAISAATLALTEVHHGPDWHRWRELASEAPPFLSPEFFALSAPLAEAGRPFLALARHADRLIGALPLVLVDRTFHALRSDHTPEYEYVGTDEGLDAIWRTLRRDRRWSEMILEKVPEHSLLATRLPALARADGCPTVLHPDTRQPFFELPDFEKRLKAHFLTNLRRCERKAGGVELERCVVPTRAAVDEAMAIEAMAWKAAAGTSVAADPKVAHLYRALLRLLGRCGRGSLYFLRVAGRRIATLLAAEDGHTLYALKIGYDPGYASVSPGHLLVWKVAADAERRGLRELNFVGRDDEWKRKWTAQAHSHVSLVVYRRSARGLLAYGLREVVKPRLPELMRALQSPLRRGCQRNDILGPSTWRLRLTDRLSRGFGIRSGIRRKLVGRPLPLERLGDASQFAPGSWVRVIDEARLRATLDERSRLRGLAFVPTQWESCRNVYRVQQQVRRIRDDRGKFRPVKRTVLLEGVNCAGHGPEPGGCGRHCPLMFRDEWLEPAKAPRQEPPAASTGRHARVRELEQILSGLDLHGRRDGLTFMPEMASYAGRRFAIVERLPQVFEYDRWVAPRRPIYLLEGLHCSGAGAGAAGPCHRACALMWHEDWLILEPEVRANPGSET